MNRVPPCNLQAEHSALGAMLLSPKAVAEVVDVLEPDHFYKPAHGHIYAAVLGLAAAGEPVDAVTVADSLDADGLLEVVGGHDVLLELQKTLSAVSNVGKYAAIVVERWRSRQLIQVAAEILESAYGSTASGDVIVDAEQALFALAGRGRGGDSERSLKDLLHENLDQMEQAYERGDAMVGLSTGFTDLDQLLSGLQNKFYVIAGRPSMGKSALATQIAATVGQAGHQVLMYSLEMPGTEQSQRILNADALVDSTRVLNGKIEEPEWNRISHSVGRLAESPLYVDDDPYATIADMRARIRRAISQRGPLGLVVIDYIQLMKAAEASPSRVAEVTEIARGTKLLQREFGIPVIGLAQAKRDVDERLDKRPMLGDLADSSELEKSADLIMYVYRDEVYDSKSAERGVAEILVRKHRGGPTGTVKLAFRGMYTRFDNMARSMPAGPVATAGDDGAPDYEDWTEKAER